MGYSSKYDNLTGLKFTRLKVISEPIIKNSHRYYLCQCDCGNLKKIRADSLVNESIRSCGCLSSEIKKQDKPQYRTYNDYYIENNIAYVKMSNTDNIMICDVDDWDRFKNHGWLLVKNGYCGTNYRDGDKRQIQYFHSLVMGKKEGYVVDHINRNKCDNRKDNLRLILEHYNSFNHNIGSRNTSGYTGVFFNKQSNKWKACIGLNHKCISLGNYDTIEEAIEARKIGEEQYFLPYLNNNN